MGEMMKDLGEKIRGQFKKIKDSNRSLSKEFCSQLIKKLDKEETANATKAQEAALQNMRPPSLPKPALMPANVEVEGKKAINNSAPMTEEEKKKAMIQEQLNEIRRMKQAKQSSPGGTSGSHRIKE